MVAEIAALAALALVAVAELLHARRVRAIAGLAFGPRRQPAPWTHAGPPLRAVAVALLAWGFITLLLLPPRKHGTKRVEERDLKHLLLVLDVSPSMHLQDAGPTGKESRAKRAANVMQSFFERVPVERYRTTVIATYSESKPVVLATRDLEVVRNILFDLPISHAFKPGGTDLFSGLIEAAKIAQPWPPRSALVVVLSDGDTVPAVGMPKMPPSVADVVVIGVGDASAGKFIDGHQSRQDASTLRQVATRLNGTYHNGNEKHLASSLIHAVALPPVRNWLERLTKREYALIAIAAGSLVLGGLPVLLRRFGTAYRPGVPFRQRPLATRP